MEIHYLICVIVGGVALAAFILACLKSQRFRCFVGLHQWDTMSQCECHVTATNCLTLEERNHVPAVAKIQSCMCGAWRGVITDGRSTQRMDVDFMVSHYGLKPPEKTPR